MWQRAAAIDEPSTPGLDVGRIDTSLKLLLIAHDSAGRRNHIAAPRQGNACTTQAGFPDSCRPHGRQVSHLAKPLREPLLERAGLSLDGAVSTPELVAVWSAMQRFRTSGPARSTTAPAALQPYWLADRPNLVPGCSAPSLRPPASVAAI